MKFALMRNYEMKAMFLKMKNGHRWGKIQRNAQWIPGIEGLDWHLPSNYVGSRMGLTSFMKLNHKMKLWTNMKFSPYQNQEWWGVILWHTYWDKLFEPVGKYSTYYPSCFQYQSYIFLWNSSYLSIKANECYSPWSMMLGQEVSCEIYTQLQQ
jgi:hypothetical protein